VLTDDGAVTLSLPRARDGTFEAAIVPKGVTRLGGINAQIISLYARGLTVRDGRRTCCRCIRWRCPPT
jgi:transposase-like protein